MFQRILVAWDGSAVAEHALRVGRDVAERYGAQLTVAAVVEVPAHAEAREDRERAVHEQARRYTQALERMHRVTGRAAHPHPLELIQGDDPALALRTYAHDHGFDLIVIGRGHRGVIQRSLAGDVTDAVAREAHCPVLVVGQET